MSHRWSRSVLAIAGFALALPAVAQFGGRPGPGGMGGPGGPPGGRDREMRERPAAAESSRHWTARHEERISEVRDALHLRPEQEAAWAAYVARVAALVGDLTRPQEGAVGGDALVQIARRVDLARNRLAALEDVADGASRLYALLDSTQRRVADRLLSTTVPPLYSVTAVEPAAPELVGRPGGRESPR